MKLKNSLPVIGLGLLIATTGCNKQINQFQAQYFNTTPNPLEVVGKQVPATVTGNIPAKFFVKNAEVTVTPVLVYEGGETTSAPYAFQGEKVRGNNPVVSYKNGGTVTIPVNYVYKPEMLKSELFLAFDVKQGSKQYTLPRIKVANGVLATAAFADAANVNPALAADKFQRIINEKYSADIHFLINQANLRQSELTNSEVVAFNSNLLAANNDTSRVIEEINISSYASPDGSLDLNTRLAENREKNTKEYLNKQLKKDKITEFGELTAQFTPEDWEGFQKLVAASDIQDKDLIISVLSMYKDPEEREREIRNLSTVFEQLADRILPQLRYSRLTASVNVIGKSDIEINRLIDTNPSALSIDELLYGATLTEDPARRTAIYEAATRLYPNDARGFNNLGLMQYIAGDYTSAQSNFRKAQQIDPTIAQASMNQGLIAMVNNDYSTANRLLGNAAGLPELNDALGTYYMSQGDVSAAVRAFGDAKTNNAAVAQIISKNYEAAKNTLGSIETPDATSYYLMAVVGARTNNNPMIVSNLRHAVKLDPSMAVRAANDIEFSKLNVASILK